jgi:acyl-CoA hydrolase
MIELRSVIRAGDGIIWGQACAEPQTLVEALIAQRQEFSVASAFLGVSYCGLLRPEHADHLRLASYCGTGSNRALADAGVLEILPAPYSQLGSLIQGRKIKCDVVMVQLSPPNARGEYSLGLGVEYLAAALQSARVVIAEVNDQVPWTYTQPLLHEHDFGFIVKSSRPPVYLPLPMPREEDNQIGNYAAPFIPQGAVIECGIGALPNAVLSALRNRSDISVHTGAICDGMADLNPKQCAGGALMGSQKLFDWATENPVVRLYSSDYTHGAATLSRIERFVAINSAVEVDLTGQVNGEEARGSYVGAVGGALDFIRAANQSNGGLSLIVIPSSRIVERLSGPVSVPRSEAGVFVTEKGAADLRGCTLRERERRMAAIA